MCMINRIKTAKLARFCLHFPTTSSWRHTEHHEVLLQICTSMLHKELWVQAEKCAVNSCVHVQHIASTWTQLNVTMRIVNKVKIDCKPVVLALVEAHLSFLDMWRHRATQIWVSIGSDNGLLPEGTKPLSDPMLTYHKQYSLTFIWEQFHKNARLICDTYSKITLLKSLPHPRG